LDIGAPPERLSATFGRADEHRRIGELIRRRSTNKGDIYRIALEGLHCETPATVLDLGCGWGAFTSALGGVAPAGSAVTGVDWMEDNRGPFVRSAASAGLSGSFLCGPVEQILDFPSKGFDIVLSGFSLYFFAGILPEIARVLKDDGVFVAITHSNYSLHEFLEDVRAPLMHEGRMTPELLGVETVLHEFNSENGAGILEPFFGEVRRTEFRNRLMFGVDQVEECFDYLMFKRYILTDSSEYRHQIEARQFHDRLKAVILARALREGAYTLAKDDAIFRCRKPAGGGGAT
jgi:SAM-dependent methyltransferase